MNNDTAVAATQLALAAKEYSLACYGVSDLYITQHILKLASIAQSLQRRYAAACSYQWADTDTYRRRTKNLEKKAADLALGLGLDMTFQPDPRGWPLIFTFNRGAPRAFEIRLG